MAYLVSSHSIYWSCRFRKHFLISQTSSKLKYEYHKCTAVKQNILKANFLENEFLVAFEANWYQSLIFRVFKELIVTLIIHQFVLKSFQEKIA